MQLAPFVILGLPRSRTAWLSKFLSYGAWTCGHEEIRHLRGLDDIQSLLSQPCTGSAETAAAPFWRLLEKYRPDARLVIVRRPAAEVVDSLMAIDMRGQGGFNRPALIKLVRGLDAKLDQIQARWQGPLLVVNFADLQTEAAAKKVFEFCLPYKFDRDWWHRLANVNIQVSVPALIGYAKAFRAQLEKITAIAKHTMLADMATKPVAIPDGLSIQEERFDDWYRDAKPLIEQHLVTVGEAPGAHVGKNLDLMRAIDAAGNMQIMTARSNGRMFGYLMTILSPSLESPKTKTGIQTTFFASQDFKGLGVKLQRASLAALSHKGVDEIVYRAGPRGSGPKMGALYRRLGAAEDGQMFRLKLGD